MVKTENNGLLFADYEELKAFNWILAIEPELGQDFFFQHNNKAWVNEARSNRTSKLKERFKDLRGHGESDMIFEIDNMHLFAPERRAELIKEFTDTYKRQFTLGASRYPAGWVHFHVFSQLDKDISLPIFNSMNLYTLRANLQSTLLFWVFDSNRGFHSRRAYSQCSISPESMISRWNRNHIACTKMDFLPWIEYRANNVFDIRLYGYYTAMTLLTLAKVTLPSPIKMLSLFSWIEDWSRQQFAQKDCDEYWRIHSDNIRALVETKNKEHCSMPILKANLWKVLFILSINELHKAREALEEYITEILGLEIKAVPFNFETGKATNARAWYTMDMWGLRIFFVKRTSWIKLLRKLSSQMFTVTKTWSLDSISQSIKKVNLINK